MSELVDDLAKSMAERRRQRILYWLTMQPNYMGAADDIRFYLGKLGTATPRNTLVADLIMLRDLGLVVLMADATVARITNDGLDVALGTAHMPGVARPAPDQQ